MTPNPKFLHHIPDDGHIDEIAVERACAGQYEWHKLTRPEQHAAVDWLISHKYSSAEAAYRLGITARTVERVKFEIRAMS